MSKKKEKIRIIKNDSNNEDYTFVKDNIITKVNNYKNELANNEKKPEKKTDE
jgi:chloramphenicol O-acetyltransferase